MVSGGLHRLLQGVHPRRLPVGQYEAEFQKLLCPCHESTFDVLNAAAVVFGPAPRPLPQLPITVDSNGYLVALASYGEPIGPGFWSRDAL